MVNTRRVSDRKVRTACATGDTLVYLGAGLAGLMKTRKNEDRLNIDRPDEEHTQDAPKRPGRAAGVIGRGETGPGAMTVAGGITERLAKHDHTHQYIEKGDSYTTRGTYVATEPKQANSVWGPR